MGVMQGRLREIYFKIPETPGCGPMEELSTQELETNTVGYITDDIAFHVVCPLSPTAVSLHLYSRPIPECNIYCPKTGTTTRRKLGFYTKYGSSDFNKEYYTGCGTPPCFSFLPTG
jgi:hypothetical protein